jgi:uncharacterized protein (UPF0332 family)
VDLLVLARDRPREVSELAAEAAFRASTASGRSVEPLVYCLDAARHPQSAFLRRALAEGKEVYAAPDAELRAAEARAYLNLSRDYLAAARRSAAAGDFRLAVDGAYNAAELAAKGLLVLRIDALPKTHGGIAVRFGEVYVLGGELPGEVGRAFHRALEVRNHGRYDWHAEIDAAAASAVAALADRLAGALERLLATGSSR